MQNLGKNIRKAWVDIHLKLFGKGDAAYTHVHVCSPSYTDEEWKILQPISKQYVFGLLIVVMIVR